MITEEQEQQFDAFLAATLCTRLGTNGMSLLAFVCKWIGEHVDCDVVFTSRQLCEFVRDTYPLIEHADHDQLHRWAEDHGYRRDDNAG